MTPEQLLDLARAGDLDELGRQRGAVAQAVGAFAAVGDAAAACELVGRAWRVWFTRGELEEGSRVAATALNTAEADRAGVWRTRALYADGVFAFRSGDRGRSLARNEQALRLAGEAGDARGECDALTGLARVALRDGRYEEVVRLARAGRARAQAVADRAAEAAPLHLQAAGTRLAGDYPAARELYLESLNLNASLHDDAWVQMEQHNLGWVELHLGNPDQAETRFRERDAHAGADAYGDAWSHLNWAAVAAARGNSGEAARRFAAGQHALTELRLTLDPDDQAELDWLTEQLAHRQAQRR